MIQNFIHLHIHSVFSLLDGFGKLELYAKRAKELGFSHLALTDHGNVDGAIKFQNACEKEGIIPIFGMEAYICEDLNIKEKGDKRGHITVLAKNETGWRNILQLITISNIDGFYYKPRIDPKSLLEHLEGLIIMTGCSVSFLNYKWGVELFNELSNNKNLYLEIMPHLFKEQIQINKICRTLSGNFNVPLIVSNDCHYVYESDAKSQEVLLAIQTKKKWKDIDRWKFEGTGYYLKDYREMVRGFREQNIFTNDEYKQALRNTLEIAEKCFGFQKIPRQEVNLPIVPELIWEDDDKILIKLCEDGFSDKVGKLGKDTKIYRERLEEEIDLIIEKGFIKYFLIVWELINWCKKNDIMTGPARGSSAGSLVCYLLGITQVDPIKFNLVFSRFISPDRCLSPETKILVEYTPKDIKDIIIGDRIINRYGEEDEVIGVKKFDIKEELYKIYYNGEYVICTGDHKWFTKDKYGHVIKKEAKDLEMNDVLIQISNVYPKLPGVYAIKNINNNKMYIGGSKNLNNRISEHFRQIQKKEHHNKNLLKDILKGDKFEAILLEYPIIIEKLKEREQYWIDFYKVFESGYNLCPKSDSSLGRVFTLEELNKKKRYYKTHLNPMSGKHHTEKTKEILSKAKLGIKMPKSFRLKMSEVTKGNRNGMYGKKHTKVSKDIISKKAKERKIVRENNPNYGNTKINRNLWNDIYKRNIIYKEKQVDIAKDFNVNNKYIWNIVNRIGKENEKNIN